MRRLFLILAVSTLAAAAAIWVLGSWVLRVPSRSWKETTPPSGSQEVSFTASDGIRLEGWWWPAEQRSEAILLLHGAGTDRLEMLPRATWLHEEGYAVLLFDFRGCGRSGGRGGAGFTERLDVSAALAFLRERADRVVLVGKGMGAAAAVMAVDDWQGAHAAVLEQLMDRFENVLRLRVRRSAGPVELLLSPLVLFQVKPKLGFQPSEFAPVERLGRSPCAVLLGYGARDTNVSVSVMGEMFRAGPYPTTLWVLQEAGNEDLYDFDPPVYKKKLREFLAMKTGDVGEAQP